MSKPNKQPLFNFFDVVHLVNVDGSIAEVDRKFGIILGMSQSDDGCWGYAVDVYADFDCTERLDGWDISEENLAATGQRVSDDYVYGGETIKVTTDGEQV